MKSVKENKAPIEEENQFNVSRVNTKGKTVKPKHKKEKQPWTKKRVLKRIVLPIVLTLVIIVGGLIIGAICYKNYLLGKITYLPKEENPTFVNEDGSVVSLSEFTHATEHPLVQEEGVHNFLLIGIDSRSKNYSDNGAGSLADVIMIMSADEKNGTIKLVTVQRDSYVYIPEYSKPHKINAAMTYGGPNLLKYVIEEHLRIDIEGFAYVNFYNMEKVIDAVGGIDIEVTRNEVFTAEGGLNALLREQNHILGEPDETYVLSDYGMLHLNGRQAVAYSRIRKVGNGDYGRSQRQVKVLNQLLAQYMSLSATGKVSALGDILEMVATDLTQDEIEKYAFDFLPKVRDLKLETLGVPMEGYATTIDDAEWSLRPDWNGIIPQVQQFLYGETFVFDRVPEIPQAPHHDSDSDS